MPGFPALRFDHVAVAVRDMASALGFLQRYLPIRMHQEPIAGYDAQFTWTDFFIGDLKLELVQSARPGSFVERFIARRGEWLHHVCVNVEDGSLDGYVAALERQGLRIVDRTDFGAGHKTAFISPRSGPGILVQFWQLPGFHDLLRRGERTDSIAERGGVLFRVDHLGIAVRSLEEALRWFRCSFPLETLGAVRPSRDGAQSCLRLRLAGVEVELTEPAKPGSAIDRFLAEHGEGFHHLTVDVNRVAPLLEQFAADGVRLAEVTDLAGDHRTVAVDPRDAHGLPLYLREVPEFERGRRP